MRDGILQPTPVPLLAGQKRRQSGACLLPPESLRSRRYCAWKHANFQGMRARTAPRNKAGIPGCPRPGHPKRDSEARGDAVLYQLTPLNCQHRGRVACELRIGGSHVGIQPYVLRVPRESSARRNDVLAFCGSTKTCCRSAHVGQTLPSPAGQSHLNFQLEPSAT